MMNTLREELIMYVRSKEFSIKQCCYSIYNYYN